MRILDTGGSGFIGSYFVELLCGQGHEVTVLDLEPPPSWFPRHAFIRGDIRDARTMRRALTGRDRIVHLAAAHHDFGIARETYFSVNDHGSKVVADAMDETGVRELVFYSTVAVYGDAPEPHHEDSAMAPNSPYGESKLAGERVFEAWTGKGEGRRCLVIRPMVTFGPRNFANMYSLIRQVHSGRYLEFGPGRNIKSLSYVENIVEATMFLWARDAGERGAFEVYNFIDKPDLTSRQITEAVFRSLGKRPPRGALPMWVGLLLAFPFDIVIALTGKNLPISSARLKKLYEVQTKFEADRLASAGFRPKIPLTEGIDRMVRWYLREGKDQRAVWRLPPREPVIATGEA